MACPLLTCPNLNHTGLSFPTTCMFSKDQYRAAPKVVVYEVPGQVADCFVQGTVL